MAVHHPRFHPRRSLTLIVALVLAAGRAQADPMYAITNLGPRYGAALNNLGDVVGNSAGDVFTQVGGTPYIYHSYGPDAGRFIDLSGQVGSSAILTGINDSGQISGTTTTPGAYRGFVDSGGQITPIATPPEAPYSTTSGINNAGAVIGTDYATYSGPPPAPGGGFLDVHGQLVNLGAVQPTAVSGSGIVVGTTDTGSAFIDQGGKMSSIPGQQGEATGVNDAGQVVGQYAASTIPTSGNNSVVGWHAFLYQNGQFQDLGTLGGPLSQALGINALGQIVGTSNVAPYWWADGHAFLYQNGTMLDLNALMPKSGWTLESATAINDQGQILGYGLGPDGQRDEFLLTPTSEPSPIAPQIPEPSTLAFFALAAAGMAIRRAWRRRRS